MLYVLFNVMCDYAKKQKAIKTKKQKKEDKKPSFFL